MTDHARAFTLHLPDGTTRHGAAFPSGRHITDGPDGFEWGAADILALLENYPDGTTITWHDGEVTA